MSFYRSKTVKAAKPYVCAEGREPIAVGEVHRYEASLYDGEFYAYRVCALCERMWTKAAQEFGWGGDEGPTMGDLRNELISEEGVKDPEAWANDSAAPVLTA